MTTILAIDTSGPSLSVALSRGRTPVYACLLQNGRTHSENVMRLADDALAAAGIRPADVDCFAAVAGPGSFTGVRIGIATVKALAHATGAPCCAVNALEALARNAAFFDGVVCPLQDARAGQVYCAAFDGGKRLLPDAAMQLSDFLRALSPYPRCCFVGDGAAAHRQPIADTLGNRAFFAPEPLMAPRAEQAALIALERPETWREWRDLAPYYLRAPQAERERAAREANNG